MHRTDAKIKKMLKKEIDPVYKELSAKMGEADSQVMPYVLETLANLEQARILNEVPTAPEEIAQKLNLDKETVDKHIQEMFEKGLLFPGRTGWHLARSWGSLHDSAGAANPKYDNDDFFDLGYAKSEERNAISLKEVAEGKVQNLRQIMRVVPRWKSIKDIPGILPCEDIREVFKAADPITLVHCACKKIDRNRECQDSIPTETCITCGRPAQYNLNRGAGRQLSYEEVMELCDSLDEYPLVHLTGNTNAMPPLICNCHSCCCGVFHRNTQSRKQLNQYALAKSRFIAQVDAEKCRGCRICVDKRCPVGAIEMKDYPELGGERAYTDPDECIGCGLCVITCPTEARKMKIVRPPEHIPQPGNLPYATT